MFEKHWKKALFLSFMSLSSGAMAGNDLPSNDFLLNGSLATYERHKIISETQHLELPGVYQRKVPKFKNLKEITKNGLLVEAEESKGSFSQILYTNLGNGAVIALWSSTENHAALGCFPGGKLSDFYQERIRAFSKKRPDGLKIGLLELGNKEESYTLYENLIGLGIKPSSIDVYKPFSQEQTLVWKDQKIQLKNVVGLSPTGDFFQGYNKLGKVLSRVVTTIF